MPSSSLQPLPGGTHAFVVAAREHAMRRLLFHTLSSDERGEGDGPNHHEEETEAAVLSQAMISRPALVVLDVELVAGDGLRACARLKADPLTCHTAVVVVSSSYDRDDFDGAVAAGADAFLVKPFSPLRLRAIAEELCGEAQARAARASSALPAVPGTAAYEAHPERYDLPPVLREGGRADQARDEAASATRLAG